MLSMAADIQQLKDIVELAGTVLHMLYACVIILCACIGTYFKLKYDIKDAKKAAIRAHERLDTVDDRLFELKGAK